MTTTSSSASKTQASGPQPTELDRAILSTVAYRDCFDFAVSLEEIHRFLHFKAGAINDVRDALTRSTYCQAHVATDGTYFCLKGREDLLPDRHMREIRAKKQLKIATKVARRIAALPHIRMVALSGALAARNSVPNDDIDFFCITDQGKLWRARALVLCLKVIDAKTANNKVCPNFFLSTAALELDQKCMYTAHELGQMVPMYGAEVYAEMRRLNGWSATYLPNAGGQPAMTQDLIVQPRKRVKSAAEWIMQTPPGNWFERFESRRKIKRFNAKGHYAQAHFKFTPERTGQNTHVAEVIEEKWQNRLASIAGWQHQDG